MGKEEKKNGHGNGISTAKAPEKPRTFERKIEHRLTQTELVQFGVKHRAMLRAIDEKNAQRKAVAVTYRQDVDAMREEEREIRVAAGEPASAAPEKPKAKRGRRADAHI